MNRRYFLAAAGGAVSAAAQNQPAGPFQGRGSGLRIMGVRLVSTRPRKHYPTYRPAPGSWSTQNVEVANPMSVYPEYKATRSLFFPDPGKVPSFTVEISTNKGLRGYGNGGPAVEWWSWSIYRSS